MMTLDCFGPAFGLADASPFCVKAMWLLDHSGQQWRAKPGADVRKAPAKKLPVLHDGDTIVADSDAIRDYLESQYRVDFDTGLSAGQKAQSRALIRLAEEHLYFCLVYERWIVEENWSIVKGVFFASMPAPLRAVIPALIRKDVIRDLKGHGIGRMNYQAMLTRAEHDLIAIETLLNSSATQPSAYLFGNQATAADASVGSILAALAATPINSPLTARVRDSVVLREYIARLWPV